MNSPSSIRTPAPVGGYVTTLRACLHAGLLTGFLLGLADGLQILAARSERFGLGDWLQAATQGIAVYVLAFIGIALLLGPLVHVGFRSTPLGVRARHAFAFTVAVGIFMELFWWTRPYVFYGRPATSPERLFSAFVMAVFSWALGALLARAIARRGKLFRGLLEGVAWVCIVVGTGAFLFAPDGPGLRGEINARTKEMPNVLLVVVDALRADVLGCYGNPRVQTPVMDDLARQGVLFENAEVQAPFTWTSFGSILTGKYPRRHGLMKMKPGVQMAPNETLAWHLKKALIEDSGGHLEPDDFASGTFMTGTLSQGSGLMRGFDAYFEALVGHELVDNDVPWSIYRSDLVLFKFKNKLTQRFDSSLVVTTAREWLRAHRDRRFLAMVHLYSTHTPYAPEPEFRKLYVDPEYKGPVQAFYAEHREALELWDRGATDADGKRLGYEATPADQEQIQNLYYAGVTQADAAIGQVLSELRGIDALENTLVIITADHGEELGDHGLWEHNWMYETNLRVPLILFWPKGLPAGVRVDDLVESVDIVPTVCDLLGVAMPLDDSDPQRGRVDGRSLVPLTGAASTHSDVATDEWAGFAFAENGRFVSVRGKDWKLIVRRDGISTKTFQADSAEAADFVRRPRLFDLKSDPGETHDLWRTPELQAANAAEATRLLGVLSAWSDSMPIPISFVDTSHRDLENEALWKNLGYGEGIGSEDAGAPKE